MRTTFDSLAHATAAPVRPVRQTPSRQAGQPARSLRWRGLAAVAALVLAGAATAAPLTVSSYSMANGDTNNYSGYGDDAYPGTHGHRAWLSGGTGDLSNGALGGNVAPGFSAWDPYVLWQNFNPTITFDLGSSQSVNQLSGHFAAFGQAAVYLPGAATLRFSLDGSTYFGDTLVDFDHSPVGADEQRWLTLDTATQQARYVQVQWQRESGRQWMALSEVQLAYNAPGSGHDVPEPTSAALALAALGGLALVRRRRQR